ncbi:hypothetical protein [Aliivibrio sp. S2MY1]|uniref:hypothetical protein n=1 Tax=Aliivibrio sp. S2MY1 TaxID=3028423 RepID=UPI00237937DA|nr:hypothetical protein [Aliivibrio sp. S2MY1]MDD9200792.1 hypothetical protein [Aliivibrio sp. S2MY1]
MQVKQKLYELEVDLRVGAKQIINSNSPKDRYQLFIIMCNAISAANLMIIEQDNSYQLACLFYQQKSECEEIGYHPLLQQLYMEYFAGLECDILDEAFENSEINIISMG